MSSNEKIKILCFCGLIFAACQTVKIPKPYDFKPSEIAGNPYGCWIDVIADSLHDNKDFRKYSGELICVEKDTLFMLDSSSKMRIISVADIRSVQVFTHANQSARYRNLTLFLLIPNFLGAIVYAAEYGAGFLMLGVPVALVGIFQAGIEGGSAKYILQYPEQISVDLLKMYSRFPAGRPPGVDFRQLRLKGASN
jgi:hypothetical protein